MYKVMFYAIEENEVTFSEVAEFQNYDLAKRFCNKSPKTEFTGYFIMMNDKLLYSTCGNYFMKFIMHMERKKS